MSIDDRAFNVAVLNMIEAFNSNKPSQKRDKVFYGNVLFMLRNFTPLPTVDEIERLKRVLLPNRFYPEQGSIEEGLKSLRRIDEALKRQSEGRAYQDKKRKQYEDVLNNTPTEGSPAAIAAMKKIRGLCNETAASMAYDRQNVRKKGE